jgi:hypothetical protein
MPNARTTVNDLAQEVADILRQDNVDRRILQWIGLAYNRLVNKAAIRLFYDTLTKTITSGNASATLTDTEEAGLGSPVALIVKNAANFIYCPQFLTPADFARMTQERGGASATSSTVPQYWTIKESSGDPGKSTIHIYPEASGGTFNLTLLYTGRSLDDAPAGTDTLFLPYHFEEAIIWGAAEFGSKLLFPSRTQLYAQEAEEAALRLYSIMNYSPDANPHLKSVTGEYGGTRHMNRGARFPTNIG